MSAAFENRVADEESGIILKKTRLRVKREGDVEVLVRKYQEDVDTRNEEAQSSSRQTFAMQDMCGALLDLADYTGSRQAKRMPSNLQKKSLDLAVLRTTGKRLRDSEDILKRGAEKFFGEAI